MSAPSPSLAPAPHRTPPAPPVLALHDVRVGRPGGDDLVHGVSLALAPGATLGIVGESGSGKTLTCRAALGVLPRPSPSRADASRSTGPTPRA
ncbi:ABC transporter [Streptomyces sp. DfronAA-171]|nr:ABC transporter [Streptomyces sp. DfronAA-171]